MASRTWEIEPASTQIVPKATYIESTLTRVTAPAPFSTLQIQYNIMADNEAPPVRAFSIKNAALVGASLYVREHRTPLAPDAGFRVRDLVGVDHVTSGTLGCTYFGNMLNSGPTTCRSCSWAGNWPRQSAQPVPSPGTSASYCSSSA